jgi:prepilin-type N-terminal cleavage/methylation domain-containing protein
MGRQDRGGACGPRGVSLPELLVVIALLALAALVTIPLTARRVHELRLRSNADQFLVTVRAARMVATTTGRRTVLTVSPHPDDRYEYVDAAGRTRVMELPQGVRIDEGSALTLAFRANGSLEPPVPAIVVLKARLPKGLVERWTVTTPMSGIPSMVREQVEVDGDDW